MPDLSKCKRKSLLVLTTGITPPDHIQADRRAHEQRKQNEQDIERAKVQARIEAKQELAPAKRRKAGDLRDQQWWEIARTAELEANTFPERQRNAAFCDYMDRERMPVDKRLKDRGITSWPAAKQHKKVLRRIRLDEGAVVRWYRGLSCDGPKSTSSVTRAAI